MKLLLMTFCYTYRSVSCSAIIRDSSSYSRWELDNVHRVKSLGILSPKLNVFTKLLPSGTSDYAEGDGESEKSQRTRMTPRMQTLQG